MLSFSRLPVSSWWCTFNNHMWLASWPHVSLRSGTLKHTTTETNGDDVGVTRHILSLLSLRKLIAEQDVIVKDHNFISPLYMWWNYYSRHSIRHRQQLDLAHWEVPGFIACFDNRLLKHVSGFVVCMPSHTSGFLVALFWAVVPVTSGKKWVWNNILLTVLLLGKSKLAIFLLRGECCKHNR